MQAVEGFQSQVRVTEHGVARREAVVTGQGTSGATQFRVRGSPTSGGRRLGALNWRQDPDGEWRVHLIELLRINGRDPGETGGIDRLRP